MAEQKQEAEKTQKKKEKPVAKPIVEKKAVEKKPEESDEVLVRVFGYDVPGSKRIYPGLTRIKGVSWAVSNSVCRKSGIDKNKRFSELSKQDIQKIENFLTNLELPAYMKNRRNEMETGQTTHLYGTDLDITKDFDLKRMKKIRSWKGVRHSQKQPVRGQRTRSHFRERKIAIVGGKKK